MKFGFYLRKDFTNKFIKSVQKSNNELWKITFFRKDLFGLGLLLLIEERLEDLEEKEPEKENPSRMIL